LRSLRPRRRRSRLDPLTTSPSPPTKERPWPKRSTPHPTSTTSPSSRAGTTRPCSRSAVTTSAPPSETAARPSPSSPSRSPTKRTADTRTTPRRFVMSTTHQPLAARMRPTTLDEVVGQDHLIFPGSPLKSIVEGSLQSSVLLWGPPGTGKTTIAAVIGASTSKRFVELSATSASVKDVREVFAKAHKARDEDDQSTILFLDEIHRFTKSQQDILLPAVEDGTIALIGATTENPSFSVISALQSRSILLVLQSLEVDDITALLRQAVEDPRGLDGDVDADDAALEEIARLASGDTRQALGRLEVCAQMVLAAGNKRITTETVAQVTGTATQRYDRNGDQHYDIVSA